MGKSTPKGVAKKMRFWVFTWVYVSWHGDGLMAQGVWCDRMPQPIYVKAKQIWVRVHVAWWHWCHKAQHNQGVYPLPWVERVSLRCHLTRHTMEQVSPKCQMWSEWVWWPSELVNNEGRAEWWEFSLTQNKVVESQQANPTERKGCESKLKYNTCCIYRAIVNDGKRKNERSLYHVQVKSVMS